MFGGESDLKRYIRIIVSILLVILVALPLGLVSASARTVDTAYIETLKKAGFPEDYAEKLEVLHSEHPKWTFTPLKVGADFDTAVAQESREGYSLLAADSAYTLLLSKRNDGYIFTDGKYAEASDLAISYFMDPRNFLLYDREMFQFLDLRYPTGITDANLIKTVKSLITSMEKSSEVKLLDATDPSTNVTYAEDIVTLCKTNNLNPYYIVSKIYQEVGTSGSGTAVSGKSFTYNGTKYPAGYYNYFNIGATSGSGAVYKGLKYAYDKGWNTRYKSIKGGIEFIAKNYTGKGQYNSYLTKFNVNPDGSYPMYSHQYMTNLVDPASSASTMFKGYKDAGIIDSVEMNFVIPVYNNMPTFKMTSLKLNDSSNSITGTLSSFTIREENSPSAATITTLSKGAKMTILDRQRTVGMRDTTGNTSRGVNWSQVQKPFWYKVQYSSGKIGWTMYENADVKTTVTMKLGATRTFGYTLSTSVSNTVRFESIDETIVSIDSKTGKAVAKKAGTTVVLAYTATGSMDYINVTVENEQAPTVPTAITSKTYTVNSSTKIISKIVEGTTVSKFLSGINESAFVKVYNGSKELGTSEKLATGYTVAILDGSKKVATYTLAVRGDIQLKNGVGDGKVGITDLLSVRDILLGAEKLTDVKKLAADVNGDGKVSITDLLSVRDILLG